MKKNNQSLIVKNGTIFYKKNVFFLKYFSYLFGLVIQKKIILITWLIYLFCVFCSLIIVPIFANINVLNIWSNSTFVFFQSLMNILIAIFTAILAINIVKIPQYDTTELVMTSKPISRVESIWCRFIVFFIYCIFINISACSIAMISMCVPSFDQQYIWKLFISMLVGNSINFGIYGAIAIIATIFFNRNVIVLINVLINIILFVWQVITMFAIKIPILRAVDDDVFIQTISIIQREKITNDGTSNNYNFTGNYTTKKVVDFSFQNFDLKFTKQLISSPNCDAVEQYWQKKQQTDINKTLNYVDIGSQLTLTYNSCGLQQLLDKQAEETFGISKFYDYNLTSPASPEVLTSNQQLDWLYIGEQKYILPVQQQGFTTEIEVYMPSIVSFFGESLDSVENVIKKQTNSNFSIGWIRSTNNKKRQYINFTNNEWDNYAPGFDEIFINIFNNYEQLKKEDNTTYFDIDNGVIDWATYINLPKYYELLWYAFTKNPQAIIKSGWEGSKANNETFKINTIEDLNTRFIQFKHYVYWKLIANQNVLFNSGPTEHEITMFNQLVKDGQTNYLYKMFLLKFLQPSDGQQTWFITCNKGDQLLSEILEENTKTPTIFLMKMISEYFEGDTFKQTSYYKYQNINKIFNFCANEEERYLFSDLNQFARSNKYQGKHYLVKKQYLTWPATKLLYTGHNMGLFFYDTKPRVNIEAFALVWSSIIVILYMFGFILYQRYDIK